MTAIWTIGHSTVPASALADSLRSAGIERLVDVRRFPRSRRHPQFNQEALAAALAEAGIRYEHAPALGGRRSPAAESINLGLRDAGLRGFADYMSTDEFEAGLQQVVLKADSERTAIMCAESLPWRCHRSLIADALVSRGISVRHIIGGRERPHALTAAARAEDGRVTYPALL